MKIAIHNAQFSSCVGGTERLISTQIKNLLTFPDVHITLVTKKSKNSSFLFEEIKSIPALNLRIVEFETKNLPNNYTANNTLRWHLDSLDLGKSLGDFYLNNFFDLVVAHFSTDSLFIPQNQKNILHLHGVPTTYSEIAEMSMRSPDSFVAVSHYVKDQWRKLYSFLEMKNVSVIYPGICSRDFIKKDSDKSYDILFVGRFISIKGIDTLVEAVSLIDYPLKVCLIGDGPEKDSVIAKINSLGLNLQFSIFSKVSDEELVGFYNSSKIGVFPSYAKEGVLLTMLEAASCGLPIITTNACSMPEFLKDGVNGLLFSPQDPRDLACKISFLLSRPDLQAHFSEMARNEVSSDWTDVKRVHELYKFYKEVIHIHDK